MHPHSRIQLAATAAALFAAACESSSPTQSTPPQESQPAAAEAKAAAAADQEATEDTTGSMPGAPKPGEVRCWGIHECKGKSACHVVGGHACAGQNDCKGKGWIVVPAKECESKGGKVLES